MSSTFPDRHGPWFYLVCCPTIKIKMWSHSTLFKIFLLYDSHAPLHTLTDLLWLLQVFICSHSHLLIHPIRHLTMTAPPSCCIIASIGTHTIWAHTIMGYTMDGSFSSLCHQGITATRLLVLVDLLVGVFNGNEFSTEVIIAVISTYEPIKFKWLSTLQLLLDTRHILSLPLIGVAVVVLLLLFCRIGLLLVMGKELRLACWWWLM